MAYDVIQEEARRPDPPPVGADAWLQAWRLMRDVTTALLGVLDDALESRADISVREYQALLLLNDHPAAGLRMSELARRIVLSRSAVTALVDRMENERLVRRVPDPVDRRGTLVLLTETGGERLGVAALEHDRLIGDVFSSWMTEAEATALAPILGRVMEAARHALARGAGGRGSRSGDPGE